MNAHSFLMPSLSSVHSRLRYNRKEVPEMNTNRMRLVAARTLQEAAYLTYQFNIDAALRRARSPFGPISSGLVNPR